MSLTLILLNYLNRRSKPTVWLITALLLVALGAIDYLTGARISIAFFYLLPVSLASWVLGKTPGRLVALASAISTEAGQLQGMLHVSAPLVFWNTAVRLGVFIVVANLITEFRRLLSHEIELSRTDSLTGILNRRAFHEGGDAELQRVRRHARPLTLVFMDVDDFKAVNDVLGHAAGDALLLCVAGSLRRQLRGTDLIARLGGDEYGILLPETSQAAARSVLPRLQEVLLAEMAERHWPVTFSFGVVTCVAAPAGLEQLLHVADQLMYAAKANGKNCMEYALYGERQGYNERVSGRVRTPQ